MYRVMLGVTLCCAGCSGHFRTSPGIGELRDESVRWVYRSGSSLKFNNGPQLLYVPGVLPYNRVITGFSERGSDLLVYEHSLREREHDITCISLDDGTPCHATEASSTPDVRWPSPLIGSSTKSGEWVIRWETIPSLRIFAGGRGPLFSSQRRGEVLICHELSSGDLLVVFRLSTLPLEWNQRYYAMCIAAPPRRE